MTMILPAAAKFAAPKPEALRTNATDRAFNTFLRTVGRETTKANKADLERAKAMMETIPKLLDDLPEEGRAALFFGFERAATPANRRKIATHPLRPACVDDMHAEADAEDEARKAAEEAEARRGAEEAEKAAADAMPQPSKRSNAADA